jgi:hypothetical protein
MSDGHPNREMLAMWGEGRLRGEQRLTMTQHLSECETCRAQPGAETPVTKLSAAFVERNDHATYEELEALVDGRADDDAKSALLEHFDACATCAGEYNDLREFRESLQTRQPVRRIAWLLTAAFAAAGGLVFLVLPRGGKVAQPQPATPVLVASLNDSRREIAIDSAGNLRGLEGISDEQRNLVRDVLISGKLPEPGASIQGLTRSRDVLLGQPATPESDLRSLEPAGTVVPELRPVFRWKAGAGITRFVVAIYTENFEPVVKSRELETAEWQSSVPLTAGQTYVWTVSGVENGQRITVPKAPDPEARFRVASEAARLEFERASQATPHSDLLEAAVAARLGMLTSAEAAIARLGPANSGAAIYSSIQTSLSKPHGNPAH